MSPKFGQGFLPVNFNGICEFYFKKSGIPVSGKTFNIFELSGLYSYLRSPLKELDHGAVQILDRLINQISLVVGVFVLYQVRNASCRFTLILHHDG
jgi:hypothetical protein